MENAKSIAAFKDGKQMLLFSSMRDAAKHLADRDTNNAYARVHRKLREACEGERIYFGYEWRWVEPDGIRRLGLKIRCPYCGEYGQLHTYNKIVEDGDILWGQCNNCYKEISVDCIITPNLI